MPARITIKELHATTGELVRRAGAARAPILITDRGHAVAVLANPALLKPRKRHRTILAEYEALMANGKGSDLLDDLDVVRAER